MFEMLADRGIGFGGLSNMRSWQAYPCKLTSDFIGRLHSMSTSDCMLVTASAMKRHFLVIIKQVQTQRLKPQDHIRWLSMRSLWGQKDRPKIGTAMKPLTYHITCSLSACPRSVPCSVFTSSLYSVFKCSDDLSHDRRRCSKGRAHHTRLFQ